MDEALRRSAAHVLVADVDAPGARRRRPPTTSAGCCACATAPSSRSPTAPVAGGLSLGRRRARARRRRRRRAPTGRRHRRRRAAEGRSPRLARPEGHRGRRRRASSCSIAERSVVRWDADRGRPPARSPAPHRRPRRRCSRGGCGCPSCAVPVPAAEVLASTRRRRAGRAGRSAPAIASIAIGPEGGWSPAELALAADRVSLGANVLRVETAAVVAAALMRGGAPMSEPFGVYVHVPFCSTRCDYCAFATWTDRPHLIGDYLDAARASRSAARSTPGCRRRRACSSAAARRRWCRRTAWPRCCGRSRWRPAPRSPSSATRTTSPRRCSRPTPARASTGCRSACSRWCRTSCARSGAPTTRPTSSGPSPRPAPPGWRRSTSTSSTARSASRSTTGG